MGPLLALTASLSWGLGDFLAGLRTRRLPVVTVLVVSQAAGLSTIALVVAIRGIGPPDGRYLFFGSLAGVAGAVGLAALYRGLAVGPMSIVAPISGTAAVVPVVAGVVTGERPSAAQGRGHRARGGRRRPRVASARGDGGHAARAEGAGLALVAALAFGLLLVALG